MITTNLIPPPVLQNFNKLLLLSPFKLSDDSSDLDNVYNFIKRKIDKKPIGNKVYELEREYLELYERIKAKEKDIEEETGYLVQGPMYCFEESDRKGQDIFERLRYKRAKPIHISKSMDENEIVEKRRKKCG